MTPKVQPTPMSIIQNTNVVSSGPTRDSVGLVGLQVQIVKATRTTII